MLTCAGGMSSTATHDQRTVEDLASAGNVCHGSAMCVFAHWSGSVALCGNALKAEDAAALGERRGEEVRLAALVLAEGEDQLLRPLQRAVRDDALLLVVVLHRPDAARDVVAVEVMAVELRQALAAVDDA